MNVFYLERLGFLMGWDRNDKFILYDKFKELLVVFYSILLRRILGYRLSLLGSRFAID